MSAPTIDFHGGSPDRHISDSLLAVDPYVAIAIARDDAQRARAMLTAALDRAAGLTRDLADARERHARLREDYRAVRDELDAARRYAGWLGDTIEDVVRALGGAA